MDRLEFICHEAREEVNDLIKEARKYKDRLPPENYNKIMSLAISTYKYEMYFPMLYFLLSNFEREYQNAKKNTIHKR